MQVIPQRTDQRGMHGTGTAKPQGLGLNPSYSPTLFLKFFIHKMGLIVAPPHGVML